MSADRASSPPPHAEPVRAHYVRPRKKTTAPGAPALAELVRQAMHAQAPRPELGEPSPAPGFHQLTRLQQLGQGLLQPLYAAGLLGRHRDLLAMALLPALLLLLFCLGVGFFRALVDSDHPGVLGPMLKDALRSFVFLAPVPSIVMVNHYGRLCAAAHERMQLGPCRPRRLPIVRAAMLAVQQVVVVAVALLPLSFAVHLVPWIGNWVAQGLVLLWALHWIVIEALDDGCVDAAPESHKPSEHPSGPWVPWFLWPMQQVGAFFSGWLGSPLRWFVRRACWLCAPWRKEITLVQQNLPVMLGFAATTAALLCTPVLNLVFRPITVVAAVRLIGQLRGLVPPLPTSEPAALEPAVLEGAAAPVQGAC